MALTVTLMVITHAAAPDAYAARLHVTAFPTLPHVPVGEATVLTVYCDGIVSDTTTFFYLGNMIEHGPSRQIFTTPANEQTEAYITGRFG